MVINMKKTIIKSFSPTKVVLTNENNTKEIILVCNDDQELDYSVIEEIWEDVDLNDVYKEN